MRGLYNGPTGASSVPGRLPRQTTYDSDAHDVVPYRDGYAVADAGANDVLWLHNGKLSVIARIPALSETVPAGALGSGSPPPRSRLRPSVAVRPDGSLYAGIPRGIPGLPGTASVYRVAPGAARFRWSPGSPGSAISPSTRRVTC
jgi:hypothetical protein